MSAQASVSPSASRRRRWPLPVPPKAKAWAPALPSSASRAERSMRSPLPRPGAAKSEMTSQAPALGDSSRAANSKRSRPPPPLSQSAPRPPASASAPAPPSSRSAPSRPASRSFPPPPSSRLAAALPPIRSSPAAAAGVLDQRARVAAVLQRVVEVGPGVAAVRTAPEVGELAGGEGRGLAGPQVDREIAGVGGEVVGVGAAAVPEGEKDAVAGRRDGDGAVHAGRARPGIPGIGGVAGPGGEVGAVEVLQGGDVQHHPGLRKVHRPRAVVVRRGADVAPVGHDRELERVERGGQGGRPRMGVLQPQRMPGLVQDGQVVVVAGRGLAAGTVEPDVAAVSRASGKKA